MRNLTTILVVPPFAYPVRIRSAPILDDTTEPSKAADLSKDLYSRFGKKAQRPLAGAANTRGHRLFQAGKNEDALLLFLAAASIDPTYGMPRYNAARIYALKGDIENCVKFLLEVKRMGRGQRDRLKQAQKDEGFKKVREEPRFRAVFE